MPCAELTKQQIQELLAWMESGFRNYADLCEEATEGEIPENVWNQVDKYKKEFSGVLSGEIEISDDVDLLVLRNDLYGLMTSCCPATELIELMLACTSDYGVTIGDLLWRAERINECLRSHTNLGFGTRPFRGVRRGIPLSIQLVRKDARTRAFRSNLHLAFFYLLLKHFECTHETLQYLLRTMQCVRRHVPPIVDYLETRGRQTFAAGALQRRVCRFFEGAPSREEEMRQEISQLLSGEGKRESFVIAADNNPLSVTTVEHRTLLGLTFTTAHFTE
jgi:hypothetical protein